MSELPFRARASLASFVARRKQHADTPVSAMIEIADRCNEVCVHCYQIQGQKGEMSTEELEKVLDELAEMGVLFLTISGGEPTLRKDFLHIVGHARKLGFAVKIFTNGITMTEELARSLYDLAVQEVQISLYSHRAELHDWVTRVPGAFDKTVRGVRALRAAGVPVVLKTPLMSFNTAERDEYVRFVKSLSADFQFDPTLDPREDGDRSTALLRISDEDFVEAQRELLETSPSGTMPAPVPLDASICGACSGNVHVEANGELRPCTQLQVPVGNAVEGLRKAYEENEDARFIRSIKWGDLHGCRDCDLRRYCHRCFATARTESGDALGPYETACRQAQLSYEIAHGRAPEIAPSDARTNTEVGPYVSDGENRFSCSEDRSTGEDERLAQAHSWIRPPGGATAPPVGGRATAGELVQIGRPGRKARGERVPEKPELSARVRERASGRGSTGGMG